MEFGCEFDGFPAPRWRRALPLFAVFAAGLAVGVVATLLLGGA